MSKLWNFLKSKWGIATIIVVLIVLFVVFHKKKSTYTFVTVSQGSITESVDVTGNTTPTASVTLAFQNSGTVAATHVGVGDTVHQGEIVATLNTADLSAQVTQAEATLAAEQAKLEGLQAGAQPEDIAASQAAAALAEQNLQNYYGSVVNTSNSALAAASDAVHTQVGSLFSNPDNTLIQLSFNTNNAQAATNAKSERLSVGQDLSPWQNELSTTTSSQSDLDTLLQNEVSYLASVRQMLGDLSAALNGATNLTGSTLSADQTSLAAGITEVNTAATNLTTLSQNIASQKLTVAQANAQLALKQAGSTQSQIDAQQASVEQAQAAVESAQAKLSESQIVAPISGTVTQMDAKVGQIATAGQTLVSIISSNSLEVDALVPETDIGKVSVGDPVAMTFDAFPNETFDGNVFYIDPAQTVTSGVVDYKVKVSFSTASSTASDLANMKSGLTADLTIKTETHTNTLILPQYAIVQNDQGNFVETLLPNGTTTTTPVTLGLQDENGNVEVLSGVTVGEQVINIGLKQ